MLKLLKSKYAFRWEVEMVKVVVVGTGGMANVHLDNYAYIKNAKVVGVVTHSKIGEETANLRKIDFYTSLDDVFSSVDFDLIDICTPTFTHYEIAKKALLQNKSVICEKPFTLKLDNAKELFELAKQRSCFIYIAQVVRFAKESKILKRVVEEGPFGKVLDAEFLRLSSYPFWIKSDWLKDKNKSGQVAFDLHIHDLDLIVSIFGEPKDYNIYKNGRENIGYSEFYRFTYKYDKFQIVAQASWYNSKIPFNNSWRVVFETAVMIFDGKELIAYPANKEKIVYDIKDEILIPTAINLPPTGWFYNELSDFINSFENKKNSNVVLNEEVLSVLKILNSF